MPATTIVFSTGTLDPLTGRTHRALQRRGIAAIDLAGASPSVLAAGPLWLVRAGAWPVAAPSFPPPSATGKALVAIGAVRATTGEAETEAALAWRATLAATGGDLGRSAALPLIASAYLETAAARALAARLDRGEGIDAALAAVIAGREVRVVRFMPLDVHHDPRLRVALAVTSLQRGGAERVVIDLREELGAHGVSARVFVLGRPTRDVFEAPPGTVDVSDRGREGRAAALAEAAVDHGADLLHAHLINTDELARIAASKIPVAVTVHNTRQGWPEGLERIGRDHAALLVACSLAAEADLREAAIPVPARTVWNGIETAHLRPTAARRREAEALRKRLRIDRSELVLLAVANPRPQKRLHLLPAVLAAARRDLANRGEARDAVLVLAGDAEPGTQPAAVAMRDLREAMRTEGVEARVRFAGLLDDIAPALLAADVLLSTSAHEGLSLAHLEALAAGLPVVATDAGGTREIQAGAAMEVLPLDSPPDRIATRAVELALARPRGGEAVVEADFSRARMAERYASLYPRAVASASRARPGEGLVIITNNFSTGGAQSSARRLLCALAAEGTPVRAAVLQEQPAYPTPGRRALTAAGIEVLALPPAGDIDIRAAISRLLAFIDAAPPRAVLFWNALADHKILLADALLDVPVFDVSPGEMLFASLDRCLQKPRPALPYRDARAYGSRLAGVIVKYAAETARAGETLGAPVHVIPNGVPLGPPPPRRVRDRLVIGTAARLSPQKKLEALLAGLRLAQPRLPPHVLRIAGGSERGGEDYAASLRELARGLEVEWLGDVEDPSAFLADLDLFAMISEPAGCPNASLEAMAAGLPVIATDFGGASDQVVDGVTGLLVPRDDDAALAEALVALASDGARRARMGEAGRARIEDRFSVARMVADYRRVCLTGAGSAGPGFGAACGPIVS